MLYVDIVLRMIIVKGDLSSIEFNPRKPWRRQDDTPTPDMRSRHSLSPAQGDAATLKAKSILSEVVVLKLTNSVVAKLLSARPVLIAAVVIVTGAYITVDAIRSTPYQARSTNFGVAALAFLVFLAGVTAEAIALEIGTEITLALQNVFGVAAMLSRSVALTPLGSQIFNDGRVQRIADLKTTAKDFMAARVSVENPLAVDDTTTS